MSAVMMKGIGTVDHWLTGAKHSLYGVAVTRIVLGFVERDDATGRLIRCRCLQRGNLSRG